MLERKKVMKVKKDRFDLEQEIMNCWNVTEDIGVIMERLMESPTFKDVPAEAVDKLSNALLGVQQLYDMRFEKLFDVFKASHGLDEYSR